MCIYTMIEIGSSNNQRKLVDHLRNIHCDHRSEDISIFNKCVSEVAHSMFANMQIFVKKMSEISGKY